MLGGEPAAENVRRGGRGVRCSLGGEPVEELKCLENEPYLPASQLCQGALGELIDPTFPEEHLP